PLGVGEFMASDHGSQGLPKTSPPRRPFKKQDLDEASQVDMVLGEGARDRGANAHLIDPELPGVGFVKLEGSPVPVRVRAAFVSDADIDAMADAAAGVEG
ncbi:hypothetical protein ACFPZ0_06710, partial [Streptomonospora nanhaiensis]